jgi:hypothetical protein
MNRRTVIKNITLIAAGAAFLPACNNNDVETTPLKNISVSSKEQQMLAELAETILPKTNDFAGAKDLKSHQFLLTMIDDCTAPEDQKKFTDGIKAFDAFCHDKFGQIFTGFTKEQKASLLTTIELKKDTPEAVWNFYKTVKRYSIQSFTSSKQYMLDVKKYKLVPGSDFKGCVKV